MKEVRDLVIDVFELTLLRLEELLPAVRAAFFAGYLRVELGLETVLVVAQRTKLPTVDSEGLIAREYSHEVLLSEINSGDFVSGSSINWFCVVLSPDDKPIGGLPDLNGSRLLVYRPVDQDGVLPTLRGEAKDSVISEHNALVGPAENVVGFVRALRRVSLPVVVMPGPNRFVELLRNLLSRLRRKYVVAPAVPPAHRRFREPMVLPINRTPVPLADPVPQISRRTGKPFKLVGSFNMEFAGQVHALGLIFDILFDHLLTHLSGRADEVGSSPQRGESMQMVELVSENVSTGSLEPMNHLIRSVSSICLDEKVNVIRPNRKRVDLPIVLFGHLMKDLFQAVCNFILEHARSSFHPPHEVVLHRVDGVTASSVWFFVDWHHSINKPSQAVFRRKSSP
jgi:hypothetical protein